MTGGKSRWADNAEEEAQRKKEKEEKKRAKLEKQRKAEEEHSAAMRIPGMLKPSQLEDKDEDI